jgi:hypothetical protein
MVCILIVGWLLRCGRTVYTVGSSISSNRKETRLMREHLHSPEGARR